MTETAKPYGSHLDFSGLAKLDPPDTVTPRQRKLLDAMHFYGMWRYEPLSLIFNPDGDGLVQWPPRRDLAGCEGERP